MSGLSHGVVRVDQDNSLTSLTLQDCGQVCPGARIVIVRYYSPLIGQHYVILSSDWLIVRCDGSPVVCKTDEVGEILVNSPATASSYWGLPGLTQTTFKVSKKYSFLIGQ